MGLRMRATLAYEELQRERAERLAAEEAAERAKNERLARGLFTKLFNGEPETVNGCEVTADGLTFVFFHREEYDGLDGFWLRGKCPRCGEDCLSRPIYDLEDLGAQLDTFQPSGAHSCHGCEPKPAPRRSWSDRLQDLLDERYELATD